MGRGTCKGVCAPFFCLVSRERIRHRGEGVGLFVVGAYRLRREHDGGIERRAEAVIGLDETVGRSG